jgi:hypothetical protein
LVNAFMSSITLYMLSFPEAPTGFLKKAESMSNRPPIFLPRKTRVEGPVFTFHRPKTRPS